MTNIINWVKQNKLTTILAIVLIYFVGKDSFVGAPIIQRESFDLAAPSAVGGISKMSVGTDSYMLPTPIQEAPPTSGADRLVIKDTTLSLVTSTVGQTITQIETIATQAGGYMVTSDLSVPEGAASGNITVRVPTTKRAEVLDKIKKTGTKVVSEAVFGQDVTDQYVDLESRLASLNTTKAKFEAILSQASSVPQILEVTRELQNIQSQIDNLKGRQQYLAKSAELTKITVNLSTDELALPYSPDQAWRPQVIVKQAVRSLIGTLRGFGTTLIWIAIYTPIWATILIIYLIVKRKTKYTKIGED